MGGEGLHGDSPGRNLIWEIHYGGTHHMGFSVHLYFGSIQAKTEKHEIILSYVEDFIFNMS